MEDRAYLSIGEVLSLLKQEFPDVTISKIRFLESQGLLDPERTPSGYRKFYETDVDRLRWILRQQREHFLPLKVIKGRLRAGHEGRSEPSAAAVADEEPTSTPPSSAAAPSPPAGSPSPLARRPPPPEESAPEVAEMALFGPARRETATVAADEAARQPGGVSLTLAEMSGATGLSEDSLRDLERFGLIAGRRIGSTTYYDEQALAVAHLAAGFMKYGVEARHLRMYKTASEREAGFFEQLVMPMVKQRNPQARRQAADAVEDMFALGEGLRAALVRQALGRDRET